MGSKTTKPSYQIKEVRSEKHSKTAPDGTSESHKVTESREVTFSGGSNETPTMQMGFGGSNKGFSADFSAGGSWPLSPSK